MKRVVKITDKVRGKLTKSNNLKMGECIDVDDDDVPAYRGLVVMLTHDGLVSIDNPEYTWPHNVDIVGYKLTSFAMQYYLEQTK